MENRSVDNDIKKHQNIPYQQGIKLSTNEEEFIALL
jgi:hypothetical protein